MKICTITLITIVLVALIGVFGAELALKDDDEASKVRATICLFVSCIVLLGIMGYCIKSTVFFSDVKIRITEREDAKK